VFHEQTQPTTAQLMRCETAALSATAAQLSVAGTIGTLPAHGLVVLFDFDYSCRAGQFDTDGEIFLNGGSEDLSSTASLLHFHARTAPRNRKEGRGSR
jgi:hypothetical protein